MSRVSVVIPALNESENIAAVVSAIPVERLAARGYDAEILVVDNASTDGTAEIARAQGARVIVQPVRGYGSAYKAGFANCTGEIIATGDADLTYPFDLLPELLDVLEQRGLDFLSTNRLYRLDPRAMTRSHVWGNVTLSAVSRALFAVPFCDSQSGMWVLRREVAQRVRCISNGMAFSQELKHEAFISGFHCGEVAIPYRPRGGQKKLNTVRDGARNAAQLFAHRVRVAARVAANAPVSIAIASEVTSSAVPSLIDLTLPTSHAEISNASSYFAELLTASG
jgi:glycosyltransferase involved in cell wall biosynthesis